MSELEYVMRAKGISRVYKGEVPVYALKNTNIDFKKGEFTAIIGKSGSGKSTLLRILATLDRSDTGELWIEGKDVLKASDKELAQFRRRRIGYVYQDYNLFPEYTSYENIVFPIHLDGRTEDPTHIENLLNKLGIEHCRNKFPHEMSGGEQQRVSIARALAASPAVILADEPTGNLDVENATKVAEILRFCCDEFKQTIVMVTHDNGIAGYADRIIRIVDGVVSEEA